MRLLNTGTFEIEEFTDYNVPQYAILSHTWEKGEVTFQDMNGADAKNKNGYTKLEQCCSVAKDNGFQYVWIDTCCIDKTSSAELSEAIDSMYRWYQEAEVCYAYLADTQTKDEVSKSRWFTRGFTLQELIAPSNLIFLMKNGRNWGERQSFDKMCLIVQAYLLVFSQAKTILKHLALRKECHGQRREKHQESRIGLTV